MSNFTTTLDAEISDNGASFELIAPFKYDLGYRGSGISITVPAGFVTDLASVPRWARPVFPIYGKYTKAAVLHDYLWSIKGKLADTFFTQHETNKIFREAMVVLHVPWLTRLIFYFAVEWFPNQKF
jgi:hypothetical protein